MTQINYLTQQVELPPFNQAAVQQWITAVAASLGKQVGTLTYVFCNDEYILQINRDFLQHDYYTDIITFDYTTKHHIAGDMVISLDTVRSNAQQLAVNYRDELMRVVIHGVLHLCGINDKGPGEREVMEAHENAALAMLPADIF